MALIKHIANDHNFDDAGERRANGREGAER